MSWRQIPRWFYPLFVVLLSYLFLGRMERITRRIALAAVLVVTGGVLFVPFHGCADWFQWDPIGEVLLLIGNVRECCGGILSKSLAKNAG